jgi:hypothetical protein
MKRHSFDPISLVSGAVFTGLGVAWLAGMVSFDRHDAPWLWAAGLVALGLAVIVGSMEDKKRGTETTSTPHRRPTDRKDR